MKLKLLLLAGALTAVTACGPVITSSKVYMLTPAQKRGVKAEVSKHLKDPYSARFDLIWRIVHTHEDGSHSEYTCGNVNAKNAFGAYVGERTFRGISAGDKFILLNLGSDPDAHAANFALCSPVR